MCAMFVCKSEDTAWESVLSLYYLGFVDQIELLGLGRAISPDPLKNF